jgi:hypothetical protein
VIDLPVLRARDRLQGPVSASTLPPPQALLRRELPDFSEMLLVESLRVRLAFGPLPGRAHRGVTVPEQWRYTPTLEYAQQSI